MKSIISNGCAVREQHLIWHCCSNDLVLCIIPCDPAKTPPLHLSIQFCCTAVWNRVLNGIWKSTSAFPVERSVLVQNAAGQFVAPQPVDNLDFPFTRDQLPDSFMSPAWSLVPDPTNDSETPVGSVVLSFVSRTLVPWTW